MHFWSVRAHRATVKNSEHSSNKLTTLVRPTASDSPHPSLYISPIPVDHVLQWSQTLACFYLGSSYISNVWSLRLSNTTCLSSFGVQLTATTLVKLIRGILQCCFHALSPTWCHPCPSFLLSFGAQEQQQTRSPDVPVTEPRISLSLLLSVSASYKFPKTLSSRYF